MTNSNKRKSKQLEINFGTAMGRLRKSIMFSLVKECHKDICYRCGKPITDAGNFTIEHKIPWQNSDTPKKLFYDINNIAFSHANCNYSAATRDADELRNISREAYRNRQRNSKLNEEDVLKIKELLKTKTQKEIASEFGVSKYTISRIATNKSFNYINHAKD